jgi:predicted DNA-binding transcriptional regulator
VIDLVFIPALWLFSWSVGVIIVYNGLMLHSERMRIRELNRRVDELLKSRDDDDDYRPGKLLNIVV